MANAQTTLINAQGNAQFLDFSRAKVQGITMEQLRRTYKETDVYTGKPLTGMYHYAFLDRVTEMSDELGYKTEFFDLFAAQNRDGKTPGVTLCPQFEQQYGERAVEAHTLRRVFANIRIRDFDTDEYTTNLSVAFHQRGIQAGFGNNVIICHNQCMLGAERYASTYAERGGSKTDIDGLLETIKGWLFHAEQSVEEDRRRIARMKELRVTADDITRIIGLLTAVRVKHDSTRPELKGKERDIYPLNQSQISDYTEDLLVRYEKSHEVTVWDMYDAATNLYKPQGLDMPQILPMNRRMVKFLAEQYQF